MAAFKPTGVLYLGLNVIFTLLWRLCPLSEGLYPLRLTLLVSLGSNWSKNKNWDEKPKGWTPIHFPDNQLSLSSVDLSPLLEALPTLLPQRRVRPIIGCLGVAHLVSGDQTKVLFAWGYWLNHDAKGTSINLCFFKLYWVISFLFQLSLAVLSLLLHSSFSVAHTRGEKWFVWFNAGALGVINEDVLIFGGGLANGRQGNPICTDISSV